MPHTYRNDPEFYVKKYEYDHLAQFRRAQNVYKLRYVRNVLKELCFYAIFSKKNTEFF